MVSRRNLLWLTFISGICLPPGLSHAEDSQRDGGSDHSGSDAGDGSGDDGRDESDGGESGGDSSGDDGGVDGGGSEENEQDRALDAVRNNHAATLKEILAVIREKYQGEIVSVSLSGSSPSLIYHIKLLDGSNRLIEVLIESVSRKILQIKGT